MSLEGRAFWIVRSSPVDIKSFLWSKFFYNCIPLSLLIVLLVFMTNTVLHADGPLMLLSAATSLMLCMAVSGLGTGFGAMYPHFRYQNIASVSMSLGGMAFMLISFGVVIATLFFESAAYYLCRVRPGIHGTMKASDIILFAVCVLLVLLINTVSFYLPMKRGERMLRVVADIPDPQPLRLTERSRLGRSGRLLLYEQMNDTTVFSDIQQLVAAPLQICGKCGLCRKIICDDLKDLIGLHAFKHLFRLQEGPRTL